MQVQKDVLIAGGVVVVCVALVVVALVATGKKDAPAEPVASSTDGFSGSSSYSSYSSSGNLTSDPLGASTTPAPADPYASFGSPAPTPTPSTGGLDGGFGAASPLAPAPAPLTPGYDPLGPAPTYTPSPTPSGSPMVEAAAPAATVGGGGTHTVAKGETLGDISATHYGTTKHWRKIVEANPGLDPARLKIGQVIDIPAVESAAPAAGAIAGGADTYTVAKGDSYYTIAKKKLGSSSRWRELERLNNIPAESLRVGTVIKLPAQQDAGTGAVGGAAVGGGKTHIVSKGETLGDISKQYFGTTTKWKQIVEANPGVRPENLKVGQSLAIPDLPVSAAGGAATAAPVGGSTYTVKSGDTLETIAAATLGKKSAWKQIVEANPGLKPTALRIGQVLAIPGGSATPAPAAGSADPGFGGPAPLPGAAPAPAPAPVPTFQDDPFYSPYDAQPAAPAAPGAPLGAVATAAAVSA